MEGMKSRREVPERLTALAVLQSRVPARHEQRGRIRQDCRNRLAGYAGEKRADFFMAEARMRERPIVLRDVELPGVMTPIQTDTLILHPAFILVLEIKNIAGELFFDELSGQFYRMQSGKREGMRNPEDQLNRAIAALENHFASIGIPLPVEGAIVMASYKSVLQRAPITQPVITVDRLPVHLENLEKAGCLTLDRPQLIKMRDSLLVNRKKPHDKYLNWYGLAKADIMTGVRCPGCFVIGMQRGRGQWICNLCGVISKDAHLATLQEYRLLLGEMIFSNEVRWFLGLDNLAMAMRIINDYGIYNGHFKRNRAFALPQERFRLESYVHHLLYKST